MVDAAAFFFGSMILMPFLATLPLGRLSLDIMQSD